jgi:L-fuculose-phosphate aldolase
MYEEQRKELIDVCLELVRRDLVEGSAGNVSMRIDDHVLITPSSVQYLNMKPEDLMVVDLERNVIEGDRNPSVESPMHLEVYKCRKDAKAVAHTHSIYASALALVNKPLPPILDELVPKLGGEVRVTSYSMAGTSELARKVVEAMEGRSAVLIANHGALCVGKTPHDAMDIATLLERACKIYTIALQIGTPSQLPEDVVEDEEDLWKMMCEY